MSLDHAAISPDGDGVEDDSPAHVKATGAWKVEVLGPGLSSPKVIATGSGDANFTWDGLVEGQPLPNGSYTLRLTELGSGQTRTVPTVISTPFSLAAQYEAFSPNATPDGVKDTDRLEIKATGAWSLQVEGHPGALGGVPENQSGNASFNWNGKVNGITLLDGKYTLRLKAGAEEKTVEVTVDTKAPLLSELSVTAINTAEDRQVAYTFGMKAIEPSQTAASGISQSDASVSITGASVSQTEVLSVSDSGDCLIKAKFPSPASATPRLNYKIKIFDKAGNFAEKSEAFSMTLNYAAEPVAPGSGSQAQYSLLANGGWYNEFQKQAAISGWTLLGVPNNVPFFYNDGSRELIYFVGNQLTQVRNGSQAGTPPTIGVPFRVVFTSEGTKYANLNTQADKDWLIKTAPQPARANQGVSVVRWNGRYLNNPTGQVAPSGKYRVTLSFMYEDCECPPLGPGGLILSGITSKPYKLQGFSVINNGDGLTWGPGRKGSENEVNEAFKNFKKDLGDAGARHAWHHIVEKQNSYNGSIPVNRTNSTFNLVRVSATIHNQLGYTPKERAANLKQSFTDLWSLGLQRLADRGWSYPDQEEYK